MADELEDNFLIEDGDSIIASDDEAGEGVVVDEQDGQQDDGSSPAEASAAAAAAQALSAKENKKRKRKEKDKLRKQKRAALSAEFAQGLGSVASQPPDMQADYLSVKQRKTFEKLSEIELDDIRLRETMIVDTSSFKPPRKEDALAEFVRTFLPSVPKHLAKPDHLINTKTGCPAVLVLTGNALRATDLARALRPLDPRPADVKAAASSRPPNKRQKTDDTKDKGTDGPSFFTVAKLFARHFKLKEHVEWLASHVTPIAVGTPQRVQALIAADALHLDGLEALIIDQTWVDAKQRTVFDTPETRDELLKLLASESVNNLLKRSSKPVKLLLF